MKDELLKKGYVTGEQLDDYLVKKVNIEADKFKIAISNNSLSII